MTLLDLRAFIQANNEKPLNGRHILLRGVLFGRMVLIKSFLVHVYCSFFTFSFFKGRVKAFFSANLEATSTCVHTHKSCHHVKYDNFCYMLHLCENKYIANDSMQ